MFNEDNENENDGYTEELFGIQAEVAKGGKSKRSPNKKALKESLPVIKSGLSNQKSKPKSNQVLTTKLAVKPNTLPATLPNLKSKNKDKNLYLLGTLIFIFIKNPHILTLFLI
jgi:hypothetical protein